MTRAWVLWIVVSVDGCIDGPGGEFIPPARSADLDARTAEAAARFDTFSMSAPPEILGGARIGIIRAVQGVIIGQLLISIVGFGALFDLYAATFLMGHFWAVLIVLFGLAFSISEFLGYLERKISYDAAARRWGPVPLCLVR